MGSAGPGEPGRVTPQPLWLPGRAEARGVQGLASVARGAVGLGLVPARRSSPPGPAAAAGGAVRRFPDPGPRSGWGSKGGGQAGEALLIGLRAPPRARSAFIEAAREWPANHTLDSAPCTPQLTCHACPLGPP